MIWAWNLLSSRLKVICGNSYAFIMSLDCLKEIKTLEEFHEYYSNISGIQVNTLVDSPWAQELITENPETFIKKQPIGF